MTLDFLVGTVDGPRDAIIVATGGGARKAYSLTPSTSGLEASC